MFRGILLYRYMSTSRQHFQELYRAFSKVRTPAEAEIFLEDILTPQELESLALRVQIIKQLMKGRSHREIAKLLGISISKVTRGSHVVQYGTGGFKLILKR